MGLTIWERYEMLQLKQFTSGNIYTDLYVQNPIHHVINFSKELFFILLSYLLFY